MTGKRRAGREAPGFSAPGPVIAPRQTRRELREQRRARRRRLGALGVAGIVVLVLAIAAGIGFGVHSATSGSKTPQDPETTMLVSLRGGDGTAIASMLAAHDVKQKQGIELLIPARLITEVCGFGTQQFGQIAQLPGGEQLARLALSQVLGNVTIDGSWTMSTADLARLVDAVGGVTVNVDTDVERPGPGGTTLVVVPAGNQRLNGARAAVFGSYQASGEDAAAVLNRFRTVFQAAVDALPAKAAQTRAVLMRARVTTTLPLAQTAALLSALAHDDQTDSLLPTDLPTKPIDTGSGPPSYRVDAGSLNSLVRDHLGASLPTATTKAHASVLIQNGVGTPGLVQSACNRLLPAGYAFAGSGNAPQFNHATSQVIVFDTSVSAARVGDDVARRLRLPLTDVVAYTQGQNVADVVVILGRDYRP